jgi:hypothetical protein
MLFRHSGLCYKIPDVAPAERRQYGIILETTPPPTAPLFQTIYDHDLLPEIGGLKREKRASQVCNSSWK